MAVIPLPARRLRDADLLNTQFRHADPENTIAGLNRGVPDPDAHPVIIGYYDETPPGGRKANPGHRFVWCCHCGKPTHWKGRVVRDDKGQTYIIGASVCGRDHYGDRFDTAENVFRAERERRNALLRWKNAIPLIAEYRQELEAILGWPGLGQLERKRDEFRKASPAGYQKLLRFIGTGVELIAHRNERDHAAEGERDRKHERAVAAYEALPSQERRARRDEGLAPKADKSQIWRRVSEPLGYVIGGDFLRPNCDARADAHALRRTLDAMKSIEAEGTEAIETTELIKLLKEMKDRAGALRDAVHGLAFADAFFEADNLDRLTSWTLQEARFSFTRDGSDILVQDSSKGQSRIEGIHESSPPSCSALQFSRHLDDSFTVPIDVAA